MKTTKSTSAQTKEIKENELRDLICDICRKMWQLGWVAANDGNISVKLGDDDYLVTPAGVGKAFIKPDDIVRVVGDISTRPAIARKPTSELKMHLRCYLEREDVNAVVHAHPPAATAFAVMNIPLDDYSVMEAALTIGSVPVTPYAPPSTADVGNAIAPYLGSHDALLLQNHGALTLGTDLLSAFYRMETLELWAKTILNARMLGEPQEIPHEELEKLFAMREKYGITGKHPGYWKYS